MTPEEARIRRRRTDGLEVTGDTLTPEATGLLVQRALRLAGGYLRPGAAFYVCSPAGDMETTFRLALRDAGLQLRQQIVWAKDIFVMGRQDYQWQHETLLLAADPEGDPPEGATRRKAGTPIHYGWQAGAAHYFVPDRTLATVWEIARPRRSVDHPTMKPVELVERAITASTKRGAIVYDPFVGSGTTIIAAERTSRTAMAIDIDPRSATVAIDRWEAFTSGTAEREA